MEVSRFRSWLPWDSRASGWAGSCSSILWSIKWRPIPLWELVMDHLLRNTPNTNVILQTSSYRNRVPLPSSISFLLLFIPLLFLTFRAILNIFSGHAALYFLTNLLAPTAIVEILRFEMLNLFDVGYLPLSTTHQELFRLQHSAA